MIVEELVTKLGLEVDSTALATLEKFRSAVSGGLSTMGIAAIGVAGAFTAMVHAVAMSGDEIDATASKLGVTTTALQELRHAADMSDVSAESLGTGLKFLAKNAGEAAAGSAEAQKAFAGIGLRDASGKMRTPDALLRATFDTLRKIPDAATMTNRAMKIFGRSGNDLIPMIKKTNVELDAMIGEAHDLGIVLDEETIAASGNFDDALKRLHKSFLGLRNTFAGPFIQGFANGMNALATGIRKSRPFFAALSAAFRDAGDRMGGMISIFKRGADALANWFGDSALGKLLSQVKGFKVLEAVLIGLGVVFMAVAAQAIGAWLAAAAPFILLAALIGFIVDDLYNFIQGNDSLIGRIQKWAEAVGDPNEHPIVKMLRMALALLLDFTSPQHWARFKKAAGEAIDFIGEKIRLALGGKRFTRTNPNAYGQLTTEDYAPSVPQQGGVFGQGGLLDALGFHRKGYDENVRSGAIVPWGQLRGPQTSAGTGLAAPGYQSYAPNFNVTVNASGMTPEQGQTMVENALNNVMSNALPAASGGEE